MMTGKFFRLFTVGKSHGPDGPPPRMKGLRLTAKWLLF